LPVVRFSNGITKTIQPKFWQSEEYPRIAIGQYPLSLAWALTIHKIQGATLTMAEMDIGQSIFEYGQTYVALSRIKSLDGLYLSAFQSEKIAANPKVIAFYDNIPKLRALPIVKTDTLEPEEYCNEKQKVENTTKIIRL
jgi:ATP-dependent DNA helicase PIF1